MSLDISPPLPRFVPSTSAQRLQFLALWLGLVLVVAAAVLLRHVVMSNTDVGWLLTEAEKMLAGQRLYVDLVETNPPIAIWAYVPSIVLAGLTGLRAETVTDVLLFASTFASLALVAAILRPSRLSPTRHGATVLLATAAVLLVLPALNFGQREHIVTIILLPALAVAARRLTGERPQLWAVIVAGIGMGLALAYKPPFALALGAPALLGAVRARSLRPLFVPEMLIAAAILAAAALHMVLVTPAYFDTIVPLMRDIYLPVGRPLHQLLTSPAFLIATCANVFAWLLRRGSGFDPALPVLMLASGGFGLAFLLQHKGFLYHAYPMLALALISLAWALAGPAAADDERWRRLAGMVFLVIGIAGGTLAMNASFRTGDLETRLRRLGPHPRLLALSGEPGLGHPLVRVLDGTWVSRQPALLIRDYAEVLRPGLTEPAARERLDAHVRRERDGVLADAARTPPDIILVDDLTGSWSRWVAQDPSLQALLAPYRLVETVNAISIFVRR